MWIKDLSKVLMCQFHYDYPKIKYGNNSTLLFSDSLTYEIKTKYVYEDLVRIKKCLTLGMI